MSIRAAYISELHQSLGYFPTWLPSLSLELGDIVRMEEHSIVRTGNIIDLGIAFVSKTMSPRAVYQYSSENSVTIKPKIAGQLAPGTHLAEADAGIIIEFGRQNAIIFTAADCKTSLISDREPVAQAVLKRYTRGDWSHKDMVVAELVKSKATTILISSSDRASMSLKASGSFAGSVAELANLSAGLEVSAYENVAFHAIAQTGLTPLFRAAGVKRRVLGLGQPLFVNRQSDAPRDVTFGDWGLEQFLGDQKG